MYGPEGVTRFVAAQLDDGHRAWGISEDRELLQNMTREFCGDQLGITKIRFNYAGIPRRKQTPQKAIPPAWAGV